MSTTLGLGQMFYVGLFGVGFNFDQEVLWELLLSVKCLFVAFFTFSRIKTSLRPVSLQEHFIAS
jgi:hypothetical protein